MLRYHLWHAADSLVHARWPPGSRKPRLARWVCGRYEALIWEEVGA